jgi:hypothetical protein
MSSMRQLEILSTGGVRSSDHRIDDLCSFLVSSELLLNTNINDGGQKDDDTGDLTAHPLSKIKTI